jgi:hypothetical protein
MDEGCEKWIQQPCSREANPDGVHDQCSVEILENNPPAAPGHANSFNEFHEVIANQNYIRAFAGDIRACAHGYADGRFAERRSVIDAIPEHGHCSSRSHLLRDEVSLLLGKQFGMNLINAEMAGYGKCCLLCISSQKDNFYVHGPE